VQERLGRGSEDDVIHIQEQVNHLSAAVKYEQRGICLSFSEPQREQIGGKPAVPCMGACFNP
jgi:hypothetical protein